MLSTYLISPNLDRCHLLKSIALRTGRLLVLRQLEEYPQATLLHRLLNTAEPEVVLLDLESPGEATAQAERILSHYPECAIIGIKTTHASLSDECLQYMHALLEYPTDSDAMLHAVEETLLRVRVRVEPNLIAFLPAKAGSGCSTIAWEVAARLGQNGRVLLIEGDLSRGTLAWMVQVKPQGSIQKLLRNPEESESFLTRHHFTQVGRVDMLLSDLTPVEPAPDWESYFRVIDAMTRRYTYVVLDLGDRIDRAQAEVLRRAGRIFLVATPDAPAVRLAQRTLAELGRFKVHQERTALILNRCQRGDLSAETVAEYLEMKVEASLPDALHDLKPARPRVGPLPIDSDLGHAVAKFTAGLTGGPAPEPREESFGVKLRQMLQHVGR